MVYVLIIKNDDGGFRCQLRDGLHRTTPQMQGRREPTASDARRSAERLFGRLDWRPRAQVDPALPAFIVEVAVVETSQGVW